MKPLSEKSYVDQSLKNRKGITWLNDCRIPLSINDRHEYGINGDEGNPTVNCYSEYKRVSYHQHHQGRFPANLLVSSRILDILDTQNNDFNYNKNNMISCLRIVNIAKRNLEPNLTMCVEDLESFAVEVVIQNPKEKEEKLMLGEILTNIIKSGIENGEKKGVEKSINKLKVDGYGNKNMGISQMVILSTIRTLTKITIQLKTLNYYPIINIEIFITDYEKITKSRMGLNIDAVSVVNNSSLLLHFTSGEQVLITDIAKFVVKRSYVNGVNKIDNTLENMQESIIGQKNTFHQRNIDQTGFSRYFDIDKWFAEQIKKLPDHVQKTFPFLIVPKPSKSEKDKGLGYLEESDVKFFKTHGGSGKPSSISKTYPNGKPRLPTKMKNIHPTVKSIELMSYLITLGTREKDIVLDPFVGSGTTCISARMLSRKYIGFEIESEYVKIANERLKMVSNIDEWI